MHSNYMGGGVMRVLVCGGRNYNDRQAVFGALHELAEQHGWLTIIQGGASGAESGRKLVITAWSRLTRIGIVMVQLQLPVPNAISK